MQIRCYQPGDELAQAQIFNVAAGALPGFKPAKPEEITRRLHAGDADPQTMYYAAENGEIVGYAAFGSGGRVSYPWSLPGAEIVQQPLLDTVLADMKRRGLTEAWATYRADWSPVLDFFHGHHFIQVRSMINYVAETSCFPVLNRLPPTRLVTRLERDELPQLATLLPANFGKLDLQTIEQFFWENPFYSFPDYLLALKDADSGDFRGVSLLVLDGTDLQTPPRSIPPCPAFAWARSVPRASGTNESTACIPASSWMNTTVICCSRLHSQQFPASRP